ncbi:MAG: CC0125/CC1285 family lipoprotein [Nitrospiraceae bacterium]
MAAILRLIYFGLTLLVLSGCATARYQPLAEASDDQVTQLNENTFRVEYRVNPFTSQDTLDGFLRRRCAEVTIQQGFDYFSMVQKHIVLAHRRVTAVTLKMFKGQKPAHGDYYDAREVFQWDGAETSR